jgi:hypothetical protein
MNASASVIVGSRCPSRATKMTGRSLPASAAMRARTNGSNPSATPSMVAWPPDSRSSPYVSISFMLFRTACGGDGR